MRATSTFVLRFPDGDFELDATQFDPPSIGDTFRRRNQLWTVTQVTANEPPVFLLERTRQHGKSLRVAASRGLLASGERRSSYTRGVPSLDLEE